MKKVFFLLVKVFFLLILLALENSLIITPVYGVESCCREGTVYVPSQGACTESVLSPEKFEPILCGQDEYCISGGEKYRGQCFKKEEITVPETANCGYPNLPCCKREGLGRVTWECTVGTPSTWDMNISCTCLEQQGPGQAPGEGTNKWQQELWGQTTTSVSDVSDTDLALSVQKILTYSMGIGGIIAFLLIVFGGFQIILSAGNPEKIKAGKEIITSAIAGLLLIIFSVFILRLIGYDILKIPGFKP